ncbi:MAG: cysteine--tRNA ligase [Treponema sp.]|nr:cysteine--tRNA ligase [Treponema sp.]
MALQLFNTMGKSLQEFVPITDGFVGFYGCGPTVYNYAHIGNLRAYVFLDILSRTLSFLGYNKKHVMNITDIGHLTGDDDSGDDKMLKTAKERKMSVIEVAQFYTNAFFADIKALNILMPDVVCKATDHIDEMICLIKKIEANGHTYMSGGNLYFDVTTYPDYGKLANLNLDELKAGARIQIDQNKKNPHDFVLWFTKSKFENQALTWESPWGRGYPGWHIECSAMSMKYLGEHFDIHTGGIDHIPIHHTNEIAQSEGATGKKWVNYWLHNEFLVIAKNKADADSSGCDKMSKSSGNFLTLSSITEKGYSALDYRYFLLGAHYRSQVFFSWDAMDSAKNARHSLVKKVLQVFENASGVESVASSKKVVSYLNDFTASLENDLSTPKALSVLQIALKDSSVNANEMLFLINKMDRVLGLNLIEEAKKLNQSVDNHSDDKEAAEINRLIEERANAKKAKDFAKADKIREDLSSRGIIITDTAQGTVWKRA